MTNKVLISTIQPVSGGVPRKVQVAINCLQKRGYQVTVAYYEPYSVSPQLSVPFFKLLFARPDVKLGNMFEGVECVGVGCWFPEFEFTHYWQSRRWTKLIDEHDFHICISGTCMAALHYTQKKLPFFAWIACDWSGDREHRVRKFPLIRRVVDDLIVKPVVLKLQRRITDTEQVAVVSKASMDELNRIMKKKLITEVLHVPIDSNRFKPDIVRKKMGRIGFVGRFEDPRKNINLLLESVKYVKEKGCKIELVLVGDELSEQTKEMVNRLGLHNDIYHQQYVEEDELPKLLNTLNLFIVPSHQEGLCIAALEAMSCGVPVISTRCGGPEDFVKHKKNGLLTSFDAKEMGQSILHLLSNKELCQRYSLAARQVIIEQFSAAQLEKQFWGLFKKTFNLECNENNK